MALDEAPRLLAVGRQQQLVIDVIFIERHLHQIHIRRIILRKKMRIVLLTVGLRKGNKNVDPAPSSPSAHMRPL